MFCCFPTLLHGAFVNQTMQVKILDRVKEIIPSLGSEDDESETLKAVKKFVMNIVDSQLTKIHTA